jgi:hypothetical protein
LKIEQQLKDVVRKAMEQTGIGQSQLVNRWCAHPSYAYEKRELVRTIVWRLLQPQYPVVPHHFDFALQLLGCELKLTLEPVNEHSRV